MVTLVRSLTVAKVERSGWSHARPLPTAPAVAQILAATLRDFTVLDPALGQLAESAPLGAGRSGGAAAGFRLPRECARGARRRTSASASWSRS